MEFSVVIDRHLLAWASAIHLDVPPSLLLRPLELLVIAGLALLWVLPPVFAVGFALRIRLLTCLPWGISMALLMVAAFVRATGSSDAPFPARWIAVVAPIVLIGGIVMSFRTLHRNRAHLAVNVAALLVLTMPYLNALARTPKQPPLARRVWSSVLQKGTWQAMNTGSEYAATRQVVFAGDRVLAVFDAGSAGYEGKQPMSKYRILSLDWTTGAVKNDMEFKGHWGGMPSLYATNDGHVILVEGSLRKLNPDLTSAGIKFSPDRGGVIGVSPDGTTLACATNPGTTLLDSGTLKQVGRLDESVPTSTSRDAALTDNKYWYGIYPKDHAFITRTDGHGQKLIFHGACGSRPEFLTDQRVLTVGCGSIRILDIEGNMVAEGQTIGGPATFAGVSQSGSRFALQFSEAKGDPYLVIYERFVVYDSATAAPVATVPVSDLPERQSWSAFSHDGRYFAVGNPDNLSLYQLP